MTPVSDGRLLHYTSEPIHVVRSVAQDASRGRFDKPTGLWISVEGEDDWREWCESEEFGNPSGQFCYEVALSPGANVLRLESEGAVLAFTEDFGIDPHHGRLGSLGFGIDWTTVAERYAGIIIAPYQWNLRLDGRTGWYYAWDCASGCIWDASAVAGLTPTGPRAPGE